MRWKLSYYDTPTQTSPELPAMAFTMLPAPKIAPIPNAEEIAKPQETFPRKREIPKKTITKAAKALPNVPCMTFSTLHIAVSRLVLVLAVAKDSFGCGKIKAKEIKKNKKQIRLAEMFLDFCI
jgi:hypothetical protein